MEKRITRRLTPDQRDKLIPWLLRKGHQEESLPRPSRNGGRGFRSPAGEWIWVNRDPDGFFTSYPPSWDDRYVEFTFAHMFNMLGDDFVVGERVII